MLLVWFFSWILIKLGGFVFFVILVRYLIRFVFLELIGFLSNTLWFDVIDSISEWRLFIVDGIIIRDLFIRFEVLGSFGNKIL